MLLFFKTTQLSAISRLNFSFIYFSVSRPIFVPNPLQSNIGNGDHDFNWSEVPVDKSKWKEFQYVVDTQYIETR